MENIKLSPQDIIEIIETEKDVVVIDIRSEEEFSTNHFIGAINIPLERIESITKFVPFVNTTIFVYCSSGIISEDAKKRILKIGYKKVYNMGGIYKYTNYIYIKP